MFIFFDLDNTLMDHAGAVSAAAADFRRWHAPLFDGFTEAAFAARWIELGEHYVQLAVEGKCSWQEQRRMRLRELFGSVGRPLTERQCDELFDGHLKLYAEHWRPCPDVAGALAALRPMVDGMGVITNGSADQQREKLGRLGLLGEMDPVVISGEVGEMKPSAGIFRHACRLARRMPGECLHVGDNLDHDARGAAAAGLWGIHIDRADPPAEPADDVTVITSLEELPGQVAERLESKSD